MKLWTEKMMGCFRGKKDEETMLMIRNGEKLLRASVAFNNGRGNPIRSFSVKELNKATNNYDVNQVFFKDELYTLYKGCLQDGRPVILKKYAYEDNLNDCIGDIVFASQMSVHKHVLKLLGSCLGSPVPILVFEYAKKGTLHDHLYRSDRGANFGPLSWKSRLKIAVDVANVVAYLHTAFSRPVVHGGITCKMILLDEDEECYVAKVTDFLFSMSIPEGETHIVYDELRGTPGYLAPEYFINEMLNEKVDVYSFGVVLLLLLTGKRPTDTHGSFLLHMENYIKNNVSIDEVIDLKIVEEESPWPARKEQQLKAVARLALQCTQYHEEERPEITLVAKQLGQIYQSLLTSINS